MLIRLTWHNDDYSLGSINVHLKSEALGGEQLRQKLQGGAKAVGLSTIMLTKEMNLGVIEPTLHCVYLCVSVCLGD